MLPKLLYLARFSRYKDFGVLQFLRKFKMAAIFGGTKTFQKLGHLLSRVTLQYKNFIKIALSSTLFEIQAFLCFVFLKKFENSKWPPFFWQVKYSLKFGKASLHRQPMGQKFCRNRSIWYGFEIQAFSVLGFFRKIRKFQIAANFWQVKYSFKLQKFCRNYSI